MLSIRDFVPKLEAKWIPETSLITSIVMILLAGMPSEEVIKSLLITMILMVSQKLTYLNQF